MRVVYGSGLLLGCVALASCGPEASNRGRAGQVAAPARHAVYSAELRSIMTGLQTDVGLTWPQGQPATPVGPDSFERVALTAERLANAAHAIPQAVPESAVAGRERQAFMQLVARLESNARGLRNRAAAHDASGLQLAMEQLQRTCTECHQQFRAVAGPMAMH